MLDSYDFDALIEEHFGRPWHSQQSGEFQSNGSSVACYVSEKTGDGAFAKIARWRISPSAGRFPGRDSHEEVHMEFDEFLGALCAKGVLEPGEITLSFCW